MAIDIRALNNSCSFLITLAPPVTPQVVKSPELFPGAYTILIDPWLQGVAKFGSRKLSLPSPDDVVRLKNIPHPDMIIISQNKPDHCHKETLLQIDRELDVVILGSKRIIKKISGWKHFNNNSQLALLKAFRPDSSETVFRIELPAVSHIKGGHPGEVTVTYMKPKYGSAHSAIGITYRPPSSVLTDPTTKTFDLPSTPTSLTTPKTPIANGVSPPMTPHGRSDSAIIDDPESPVLPQEDHAKMSNGVPISPQIPLAGVQTLSKKESGNSSMAAEKTVSLLWCAYGADYKIIAPWASSLLIQKAALPLSVMFHTLSSIQRPWYSSGIQTAGSTSGIVIAKNLMPHLWISCLDEPSTAKGWGLHARKIKHTTREAADVQAELRDQLSTTTDMKPKDIKVKSLGAGQNTRLNFKRIKQTPMASGRTILDDSPAAIPRFGYAKKPERIAE